MNWGTGLTSPLQLLPENSPDPSVVLYWGVGIHKSHLLPPLFFSETGSQYTYQSSLGTISVDQLDSNSQRSASRLPLECWD